ncbi:MAG: hypothetical protein ACLPYY_09995, partial [Acidimicrobiales bacterium]
MRRRGGRAARGAVRRVGDGGDAGPAEAEEQLRSCLALGASAAVLLETPAGVEFGPAATAEALHS